MQYGQFFAHDIAFTPSSRTSEYSSLLYLLIIVIIITTIYTSIIKTWSDLTWHEKSSQFVLSALFLPAFAWNNQEIVVASLSLFSFS